MGNKRHHAIIVTCLFQPRAYEAYDKAVEIFGPLVSPLNITPFAVYSFAVFPDGMSEGWSDSNEYDKKRALYRGWLASQRYSDNSSSIDWVEVQYGDEEAQETKVIADSDEKLRDFGIYD